MDVRIARAVHFLRMNRLANSPPPTTLQAAPVMDRYHGLRPDRNSINTSQPRRVAKNRMAPHANRLNTIHTSRVTPKGLFRSIDSSSFKQDQLSAWDEAVFIQLGSM